MAPFASIIRTGALASLLAMTATAAFAQLPTFTVNPSAILGTTSASGPFTADQANIQDFSTVTYGASAGTNLVNFTDVGFLPVTNFTTPSGSIVSDPKIAAANGYGLYFQFTATGTQATVPAPGTNPPFFGATFTSLNYSLYAFDEGAQTAGFSADGTTITNAGTNKTLLATGTLKGGNASIVGTVPGADVFATVSIAPGAAGFFVSPSPFYISLESAFINTSSEVHPFGTGFSSGSGFTIVQGGGSVTFIPEPATLALLGVGLAGIGLVRRRNRG